jgi:hypothetical protein
MDKEYLKDISRLNCSFFDIKAWYLGESEELQERINFGFYNSIFVIEDSNVTLYYDKKECEEFYKILDKILTEDFFNGICNSFFKLIEQEESANTDSKIFELMVAIWPALTIFHEISNYPGYANDSMLRRLIRLRKTTEDFSYRLSERMKKNNIYPKSYIYFQGKVFEESLDTFIKKNNIKIVNETRNL